MPKIRTIFIISVVLSIILSFGCKRKEGKAGDPVFKYSTEGTPINMDPVRSATKYSNLMVTSIYETLYEYKYLAFPYSIKPGLAASMPEISNDNKSYTIRLKAGVKFKDDPCFPDGKGREVTAHDFVYSLKRTFDPSTLPQGEWLWQNRIVGLDAWKESGSDYEKTVSGLQAGDDLTVHIELVEPYPQLIYTLAMGFSAVVPREAVEFYGQEFGINPVGSSSYMLESFNTKKAVLVKNPNYRHETFDLEFEGYNPDLHGFANIIEIDGAQLPIMKRVEIHFLQEASTRWNSFTKGDEIQYSSIPIEQIPLVTDNLDPLALKPDYAKKYRAKNIPDFGLVMTYFNMDDPRIGSHEDPEQNRRNRLLRQAIRYGYDWPQRNRRFYNGIGMIFPGVIPPGLDAFDENMSRESVTPDYEKGKRALKEGGWTTENLPVLEWCGVASVRSNQYFEQFRGWMEQIGYPRKKVKKVSFANFGDYNKAVKSRECMIMGMGWGLDYPDSENVLQLFYGPNQAPGSNSSNYDDPEYNRLFEKAKTMLPSEKRTEIYRKLNQLIVDDCPAILGLSRNRPYVWHKNVIMYPSENVHGSILKYIKVLDQTGSVN